MSSDKRKTLNLKKIFIYFVLPICALIFILARIMGSSSPTDLQTILQNLPKEITDSISSASNSKAQYNEEMLKKFQELSEQLMEQNKKQQSLLETQRHQLEAKISDLKQPPEAATLREKLTWAYSYELTKKFPAYVWQTWNNDVEMDQVLSIYHKNWINKNPGFVVEVINDDIMSLLVYHYYNSVPEVIEAFDSLPTAMLKADFFRFLILYVKGGVFADIDTNPLQPIPNWIPENVSPKEIGVLIGVEIDYKTPDWKGKYNRRLQFGTSVIQAKPKHPVIREVIARITETSLRNKLDRVQNLNLKDDLSIMNWTGIGSFTDVLMTYFNDYIQSGVEAKITWRDFHNLNVPKLVGDVLVAPLISFNSPPGEEIANSDEKKPLYFVQHKGMKSWKSSSLGEAVNGF
ncbi:hypothetical protein QEN19_001453 [Hanseniaspora menglaensis]